MKATDGPGGRRTGRVAPVVAAGLLAALAVGCGTGGGEGADRSPAATAPGGGGSSPTAGGGTAVPGGKGPAAPSGTASGASSGRPPTAPGGGGAAAALTCDRLRDAELQGGSLRLPDAPVEGSLALTDGRWEGEGVVIELQPQCGIGDVTGDRAADAVAAIKVTTGGTGKFYGLVTWRNDGGTPVPAAAVALGDRTPVVSIDVPAAGGTRRATVVYRTRGDDDPAAVVNITRTAVYEVSEPNMVEVSHSDVPYTP